MGKKKTNIRFCNLYAFKTYVTKLHDKFDELKMKLKVKSSQLMMNLHVRNERNEKGRKSDLRTNIIEFGVEKCFVSICINFFVECFNIYSGKVKITLISNWKPLRKEREEKSYGTCWNFFLLSWGMSIFWKFQWKKTNAKTLKEKGNAYPFLTIVSKIHGLKNRSLRRWLF